MKGLQKEVLEKLQVRVWVVKSVVGCSLDSGFTDLVIKLGGQGDKISPAWLAAHKQWVCP